MTFGAIVAVVEDAESFLAAGIRALHADGDLLAGRRWFDAAYGAGEQTGDALVMAEAALGLGGLWVDEHRTAAGSGSLCARLRRSLRLIDPKSAVALRVRIRLAAEADYRAGAHTATLAVLDEARASSDPVARAEALSLAHQCLRGPDHGVLRRALADELVGDAAQGARRTDLLMGLLWQVVDRFLDADPHAERRLGELRGLLAEDEHRAISVVVEAIEVMLAVRAGRLEEAEQLARDCLEQGTSAGHVDAPAWFAAQIVAIRWYQGRLGELLPMLTELVNSPTLSVVDNSFFAALAVAAATAGDHRTAERLLAALRGRALADLPRSGNWLVTMYGIVEAARLLGDAKASAAAYELLAPFADLPVVAGPAVVCFGSVHHALGVASLTTGETERAVAHLREAVHRDLALGHWPALLVARQRFAEALERRGQPDDEAAAKEQRALATELASTLGTASPRSPSGRATCTRHGRRWRIQLGGRAVLVDQSVGLLHLAVLTANPEVEIPALDLAVGLDALARVAGSAAAQPVLDRAAVQRYRQRLTELDQADPDGSGDDQVQLERDWVLAELAAGSGLGGRARAFPDNPERARLAVGRAIRRALTHIERADPTIGAHLRAGVHTGIRCWYRPT
ncbi:hypothetical protein [Lentzea tibetensis]|uniref:hypothetical protein n=1 Tax=Lentzea tibetensis TaxID=2591470 RepID=UPI001F1B83FF|nr:hypothetical protein [Lentzea tibetensis]